MKKGIIAVSVILFVFIVIQISLIVVLKYLSENSKSVETSSGANVTAELKQTIEREFSEKLKSTRIARIRAFEENEGLWAALETDGSDYAEDIRLLNDELLPWLCEYKNKLFTDVDHNIDKNNYAEYNIKIYYTDQNLCWSLVGEGDADQTFLTIQRGCSPEVISACSSIKILEFNDSGNSFRQYYRDFASLTSLDLNVCEGDDLSFIKEMDGLERIGLIVQSGVDLGSLRVTDDDVIIAIDSSQSRDPVDYQSLDSSLSDNMIGIKDNNVEKDDLSELSGRFSKLYLNGELISRE